MRVNLPNQITIGRLFLSIGFVALLSQYQFSGAPSRTLDVCAAIFVLAALTDWLDGYLARRNNQVTALGRVLDPFVDKILVCGAFVLLSGPGFVNAEGVNVTGVAPWMVVVIIGRELLVSGLRGFSESQGQSFAASFYGKAKMVVQSTTAPAIILIVAHPGHMLSGPGVGWATPALAWLTVIVTLASLVAYLIRARHILAHAA